jgi:uncharacterized membrane protein
MDKAILIAHYIFVFFLLGFLGWIAESINESITRRCFVNKGFFKGPFVLCQAIGGAAVYAVFSPLKENPLLVFLGGMALCTLIEYLVAVFLDRCFNVKCWDYRTYPHTRWCHFQGRIALTISLFFGLITLFVVYLFWDFAIGIAEGFGRYILGFDAALIVLFLLDVFFACKKVFKAKKTGSKISGFAVFSGKE